MRIAPAAQPGELPFGQLARGNNALLFHLCSAQVAVEVIPHLAITYSSYRRQAGVQVTSLAQAFDLFEQALFQHQAESLGDTLVQDRTLGRRDNQLRDSIGELP